MQRVCIQIFGDILSFYIADIGVEVIAVGIEHYRSFEISNLQETELLEGALRDIAVVDKLFYLEVVALPGV